MAVSCVGFGGSERILGLTVSVRAPLVNNAFSQTAALLAVAVLGVIMFAVFSGSLDARLADLDLPTEAVRQLEAEKINLAAAEIPDGVDDASGAAVERAIDEAFVSGYRVVMLVAAAAALASALSAALLIESKKTQQKPVEQSTQALAA